MFEKIIHFSLRNKLIVLLAIAGLVVAGIISIRDIPLDAVPDITNNQVQIVTNSPTLAAEEVEQYITFPIEARLANIPGVMEVRSISRYGLSVITVVFEDHIDIMIARQFVNEQLKLAAADIPPGLGSPEMMPITTGLGEIYQYVLTVKPGYEEQFGLMELRTIQDWIVKRQMTGIQGIIEVSSFGGLVKQYEVALDPQRMLAKDVTANEVFAALEVNNANSGGSYIEQADNAWYIRTEGRISAPGDISDIVIRTDDGVPLRVKDVATVGFGSPKRYGAMTMDGHGEVVGGITLMLKGANSSEAIENVHERIMSVSKALPEGVEIYPYLDRSVLVGKTIHTVVKNLVEGGLIVIFVLVLMLGNLRAGFVVASVIPLSMLFALIMMNIFNVSANLMSLGAIDFGIVVDGAVIIVEAVLHHLHVHFAGQKLTRDEMDAEIGKSASNIYKTAAFGVLIILIVFVPIFSLQGVEGKMFLPMAQTVSFAILGSLILSLTYVPVVSSLILRKNIPTKENFADSMMRKLRKLYEPLVNISLTFAYGIILFAVAAMFSAVIIFSRMGSEFVPTLEEGDLAMQMSIEPGSSLNKSLATATRAEAILIQSFPEVLHVVSKIGTAEVPTDPMAIEDADIMILLKEKDEWVSADDREELIQKMKEELMVIDDASFEFTQPIQLRFNELMTGAKTDIAVKIFGEDVGKLKDLGDKAAAIIRTIPGAGDVKVEQTEGLRQLTVRIDRRQLSLFGLDIDDVNQAIRIAYAGDVAGVVYENERRFDLAIRLKVEDRQSLDLQKLFIRTAGGEKIALSQLAKVVKSEGPMMISREDAKRRIAIGVNVRDRDVASLVADIQSALDQQLILPPGYTISYGGQFENLQAAIARMQIAVPVALALILFILYLAFGSLKETLMIFGAVPMAAVGGVFALMIRDMPFSISAGVGFIALFGVAVLNGIVLMSEFRRLKGDERFQDLRELIIAGASTRLRPVLMTALVASLGFLPMAISSTSGAEVQRPLATVVIGGLVTSTILTLLVLPAVYYLVERRENRRKKRGGGGAATAIAGMVLLFLVVHPASGQNKAFGLPELKARALEYRTEVRQAELEKAWWLEEKNQSYVLDPLQAGIQFGQINYEGSDYQFEVSQGLRNPWTIGTYKAWAEAGAGVAGARKDLLVKETIYAIESEWITWIYLTDILKQLGALEQLVAEADTAAYRQYRLGSIGVLDYQSIRQVLLSLLQMQLEYRESLAVTEQQLRYLAMLGDEHELARGELTRPEIQGIISDSLLDPVLFAMHSEQVRQLHLQDKMIRQEVLPEISIGYFNQSLNRISGYQGVLAGFSIPIFASGRKSRLAQNDIRKEEQQILILAAQKQYETELQQLKQRLLLVTDMLAHWPENYPSQLSENERHLLNLFREGEIGYPAFAYQTKTQLEMLTAYYALLNEYNQLLIRIQFITRNQ